MNDLIKGEVIGVDEGMATIKVAIPSNIEAWCKQHPKEVVVRFLDSRKASYEQIKKAHALVNDIADWIGDSPEWVKLTLKKKFILENVDTMESDIFSFKDCSVETARLFITFLIDLVVQNNIPTRRPMWEQCEDIHAYIYACCMNKTCCVCGRKGVDLHHVVPLGMGADRKSKPQLGYPVLPLCREHHTIMHTDSKKFLERFHLEPIPLTDDIAKFYGFSKEARQQAKEFDKDKD